MWIGVWYSFPLEKQRASYCTDWAGWASGSPPDWENYYLSVDSSPPPRPPIILACPSHWFTLFMTDVLGFLFSLKKVLCKEKSTFWAGLYRHRGIPFHPKQTFSERKLHGAHRAPSGKWLWQFAGPRDPSCLWLPLPLLQVHTYLREKSSRPRALTECRTTAGCNNLLPSDGRNPSLPAWGQLSMLIARQRTSTRSWLRSFCADCDTPLLAG